MTVSFIRRGAGVAVAGLFICMVPAFAQNNMPVETDLRAADTEKPIAKKLPPALEFDEGKRKPDDSAQT